MQVKMIGGALVIEPAADAPKALDTKDFADKPLTVETEPAFYVALGKTGLLERSVSVTTEDRKTVAALVGNWIAEGYQPVPCDIRAYAKHIRALAAANKPAKVEAEAGEAQAEAPAAAPAGQDI